MAWFGRRSTSVRRRGAGAAAVVAVGLGLGVVAMAPSPAGAIDTAEGSSPVPGFLLREGRYSAFEAPDADVAIYPSGINDRGEVTGEYIRDDGESGFVRRRDGRITTFDVPGARGTEASKINDRGQIVGRYSEDTPLVDDSSRVRGYVRHRGRTTRIDFPGASHTHPTGINDRGDVVGRYLDDAGAAHGFLLTDARYATISVPGASATIPSGINDRGEVVGYTADDLLLTGASGFRRVPGATAEYTPIAVPGASRSLPLGTNDRGDVVGLNESPGDTPDSPDSDGSTGTAEQMPGMPSGMDLVTVRGITVSATIAEQVEALLAAAEADGFAFTGGGYRDNARQIALRRMNCGTSYYAIYEMPSSQCSPPTARPGTSMHERGLAIDFSCGGELVDSRSNPCFQWLDANAERYGLYNLPSEPWHWSVNGQ